MGVGSVPPLLSCGSRASGSGSDCPRFLGQSDDLGGRSRFPGLGSGMEFVAVVHHLVFRVCPGIH